MTEDELIQGLRRSSPAAPSDAELEARRLSLLAKADVAFQHHRAQRRRRQGLLLWGLTAVSFCGLGFLFGLSTRPEVPIETHRAELGPRTAAMTTPQNAGSPTIPRNPPTPSRQPSPVAPPAAPIAQRPAPDPDWVPQPGALLGRAATRVDIEASSPTARTPPQSPDDGLAEGLLRPTAQVQVELQSEPEGAKGTEAATASPAAPSSPTRDGPAPPSGEGAAAELAFREGWEALEEGRYETAALRLGRAAASEVPVAEDAGYWRAVALRRAGRNAAAELTLEGWLLRFPHSPRAGEVHLELAWWFLESGRREASRVHGSKACSDPRLAETCEALRRELDPL